MKINEPSFSVISVTLNAEEHLPNLINSIKNQSDQNFIFVVFDGGSTDETISLLQKSSLNNLRLITGRDFGIYDALNQCLSMVDTDYYVVCGADDELSKSAIANFKSAAIQSCADIVVASFWADKKIFNPMQNMGWLYAMRGVSSGHAVGMAIRRDLHKSYGMYSRNLPIAADQLFVKSAKLGGAKFFYADFIAGVYGTKGASSLDFSATLTEIFRVQLKTEKFKLLQVLLFLIRLIKNYKRL